MQNGNGAGGRRAGRSAFFDWRGSTGEVSTAFGSFTWPLFYYDVQAFQGVFTASLRKVQRLLPSPTLFPVRWSAERAVVAVAALRYPHFAWRAAGGQFAFGRPYGEIAVLLLCTEGRPAPRVLPLLEWSRSWPLHAVGYVLYLPVTTLESRDGGRIMANFPKFVADMHFEERDRTRSVRLEEDGRHILTMTVRRGGLGYVEHKPMHLMTDQDARLARTVVSQRGRAGMRVLGRPARLELGDHGIADVLRELELSPEGTASFDYYRLDLILPHAEPLPQSAHRVVDYRGRDIPQGRLTVTYEPGATVDLYAPTAAAMGGAETEPLLPMGGTPRTEPTARA